MPLTKNRRLLVAAWMAIFVGAPFAATPGRRACADQPPEAQTQPERDGDEDETLGAPDGRSFFGDDPELDFGMDRLFVPRWRLTDGPHVRAAFRDVVQAASRSTVSIRCDGKQLALGGVVGAEGWVLTKATPLCGKMTCLLPDGRELPATTVGKDGKYDLALLKLEATGLAPLDLSSEALPPVGSWIAAVGKSRDPVAVGVISVGPRLIPAQSGVLGVVLDDNNEPVVVRVLEDSPAENAGVQVNDRIDKVSGVAVTTRDELIDRVRTFNPGDEVELEIVRGGERRTLKAVLSGHFPGLPPGRSEFQNSLGGSLSVRRFGFPTAFQHDAVLRPADCGGPAVDLDGRVVGFNIARAGRTESYAIPTAAVRQVVEQLMAQGLAVSTKANASPERSLATPLTTPKDAVPAAITTTAPGASK